MQDRHNVTSIRNAHKDELPKHWIDAWLLHVLQRPNVFLMTDSDYVLTVDEQSEFNTGIQQMQAGKPLAYLIGQQEFWSLPFKVNEHTLIPRPDTEVLVEQVLAWITQNRCDTKENHESTKRLLDLGTGSGCIAISLAYELNKAYPNIWGITAVDISTEALKVAKLNATLNKVNHINFIQSSWFNSLQISTENKFDVIVSNPPYIIDDDPHLKNLTAEPLSALVASDNGLADIRHIVTHAQYYLVTNGLLAIEHGHDQGEAVREIFCDKAFSMIKTIKDYGGNDRITLGIRS